jgi:NADH-quinone oxidoreductase subunit M
MSHFPWLTVIIFLPLAGAALLFFVKEQQARWLALTVTLADFFLSLPLWFGFDPTTAQMQFTERAGWIASPSINYALGLDGISLPMVLLTTFLTPFCVGVSWRAIESRVRLFMASLLIMETAMLGVFAALDFVLFYVFWEAMLIPMYLLIGVWGGPNRVYAAVKFFLYTLVGSVLLLAAIIALYFKGGHTFDILLLGKGDYAPTLQSWLFWAFFAAFAVKVPMFPFHTWLPDAHVEAPTAGSVILASVLLKMGAYGFLRFTLPLLPDATASFTPIMIALSVVAILYGAYMALAQADLKKLIAYSSVSHMGFVTLGIFALNAQGIEGAILQMVNHGITTGALFLCVGIVYERTHSRQISDNGGLTGPMPKYATFLVIFSFSSIGLPGTNSFVGEFLVLAGTFFWSKPVAALASLGIILAAAYMLWMVQRVAFGARPEQAGHGPVHLSDLSLREMALLAPLVLLVFWIGLMPNHLLAPMHASVTNLLDQVDQEDTAFAQAPGVARDRVASLADHVSRIMHQP